MKYFINIFLLITLVYCVPVDKWHRSGDGSLFFIEAETKYNWYQAWNECARKNMSLIAIDTFYKHTQIDTLIKRLFPQSPSFWLAGHDNAVDRRYEWATSGQVFSFTNWGVGQPDRLNNSEHCILIWHNTWQWYDLPCSHNLGFICEENAFLKEKNRELAALRANCGTGDCCRSKNVVVNIT
ncbi:lectin subunit alpha-like [Cochliomyia hominivorax]